MLRGKRDCRGKEGCAGSGTIGSSIQDRIPIRLDFCREGVTSLDSSRVWPDAEGSVLACAGPQGYFPDCEGEGGPCCCRCGDCPWGEGGRGALLVSLPDTDRATNVLPDDTIIPESFPDSLDCPCVSEVFAAFSLPLPCGDPMPPTVSERPLLPRSDRPELSPDRPDEGGDPVWVFNGPDCELISAVPGLFWSPWSLIGDDDPAWPVWAACAGRHMIRIPSDRIRNIRPNSQFIQVLYSEKLLKYNLIAAATFQIKNGVL
jgi:hypothetical protein